MKNIKKSNVNLLHSFLFLAIAVIIGMILGVLFYLEESESSEVFAKGLGIVSVAIPLIVGLTVFSKNKDSKDFFKLVAKRFVFAIICVSFGLIAGAIVSAKLYCTYGACSEFAGFEILLVLMWIPWMIGISAVLTLAGIGLLLSIQRSVHT